MKNLLDAMVAAEVPAFHTLTPVEARKMTAYWPIRLYSKKIDALSRHLLVTSLLAAVTGVILFLATRSYAQESLSSPRFSYWQSFLESLTEHAGPLIIAAIAVALAFVELEFIRRALEERSKSEKRRSDAKIQEREKKLELEERRFNAEQGERDRAAAFRAQEHDRFYEPSIEIAKHLIGHLSDDSSWAVRALEKAKVFPYSNSLFGVREDHFRPEKAALARQFTPHLLRRICQLAANDRHVFLLIDAGTTLFSFFEILAAEVVRDSYNSSDWLDRFHIATNNLPGIGQLIKSGKRDPRDRHSPLAIKHCHLLPGEPLPVYAAIVGEETEKAIQDLPKRFAEKHPNAEVTFIALVTGNWIRIRRSEPRCPVVLARGDEHLRVKQELVNIASEVFIVSPLGKIFVDTTNQEINRILGYIEGTQDPGKRPYEEIQISDDRASKVQLVSTARADGRLLHEHSNHVEFFFSSVLKMSPEDEDKFDLNKIDDVPHVLFPFGELPNNTKDEFMEEFPHEPTRSNRAFLRLFKVNRDSIWK